MTETERIVEKLNRGVFPQVSELEYILGDIPAEEEEFLFGEARRAAKSVFGNKVYIRGLIEFTNFCRNDCLYCGIRRSQSITRYRLTEKEILDCCKDGYLLGFRTFVLQGGEDSWFNDSRLVHTVSAIREKFPDCAITLSVGERSQESYRALKEAGADRFLLRHETADCGHYGQLHPGEMSFENRMECLRSLKELGYQTGCGFMVGSPYQTMENLIEDLRFIWEFKPAMVGIGPFIPAKGTPFEREAKGSAELTLRLLSVIRLMRPDLLLPATTALGTAAEDGRTRGILAGANVIMPNLSPENARKNYSLYDNKLNTGCEAAENLAQLKASMAEIGYEIVTDRGDSPAYING